MSRKTFFAWVLSGIGLRAQTTAKQVPSKVCWIPLEFCNKPENGQCPVCGTLALEIRKEITPPNVITLKLRRLTDPTAHIQRCRVCSAAYWQDAMEVK